MRLTAHPLSEARVTHYGSTGGFGDGCSDDLVRVSASRLWRNSSSKVSPLRSKLSADKTVVHAATMNTTTRTGLKWFAKRPISATTAAAPNARIVHMKANQNES